MKFSQAKSIKGAMNPIIAGLVSTFAMTLFVRLAGVLQQRSFQVIRILGTVMRFKREATRPTFTTLILAACVHYAIGLLFTSAFLLLISRSILQVDFLHALLFGSAAGALGVAGWLITFALHPQPPVKSKGRYIVAIFLGHLVLSLCLYFFFRS